MICFGFNPNPAFRFVNNHLAACDRYKLGLNFSVIKSPAHQPIEEIS